MPLTPPAPSPVPAFAKGLVNFIEDTLINPYRHLYTWVAGATAVTDMQWRYVVLRFSRNTPAGTAEDYAQFGFNVVNITGGDIDKTWTDQDYTDVQAAITEFWTYLQTHMSTAFTLVDIRYYLRQFNPKLPLGQPVTAIDPATNKPYKRFAQQGPPAKVFIGNAAGAAVATVLPYQHALSVTFKTPAPRHWGRIYIPGLTVSDMATLGRFSTVIVTGIANQAAELVDDLAAKGFQLVVPTTQVSSVFSLNLQMVTAIQVDDIPDVIRRRRAKMAAIRTQGAPLP